MANILDLLNIIGNAIYGRDVRQAIIDAIRQCYEDGKAGVNDLQARTLIEAVMAVNEQQEAEIESLQARVDELEGGGSGGSSETSTTSVPTFLVESGTATFENVGANKTATKAITFTENFTEVPTVLAIKVFRQGANTFYSQVTAQPIQSSITAAGFTLAIGNKYTQAVSPSVLWVAFQPTTVEVETEITTVDGMSEADVRALLAPITAALDSLKIGYDGTEYDTVGASLREQINALHILIGDEPGTAIQASAVAYGDSNVETAIDDVKGRLQLQPEAIRDTIGKSEIRYYQQVLNATWQKDKFISMNVAIGATVNVDTPTAANNMVCAVVPCTEGDMFTLYGRGLTSGRLWGFVDSNNILLMRSSYNAYAYGKVVTAPANAANLIVNFNATFYYCVLKGDSGIYGIGKGNVYNNLLSDNYYIKTNDAVGSVVDMTPVAFRGITHVVLPCDTYDKFLITGQGGGSARLWCFVDADNKILRNANSNETAINEVVEAPNNACKLIINSNMTFGLSVSRNIGNKQINPIVANYYPTAEIHDLPKDYISNPTVGFKQRVQETEGISAAKGGIFQNGEWFCVTYGENVDGTSIDIPLLSESGCLVMKYKRFRLVNGVESDVEYGTFARKGGAYTKYDGTSGTFEGGCGLPSGENNLQFFTSPYHADENDPSYTFAGYAGYGMTPCCCSVTIGSDGTVTFGEIKELKLKVHGEVGKFDLRRVDPDYQNKNTYLTTGAPYWFSSAGYYVWYQIVTDGFVYLWSYDGVEWTFAKKFDLPFQPKCEIEGAILNKRHYVAIRTNTKNVIQNDTLYLAIIDYDDRYFKAVYKLPFAESRAQVVVSGSDILLFYSPGIKSVMECIRIVNFNNEQWSFWRWFTIYKECTWYITCEQENIRGKNFSKMYLCGGNNANGSPYGITFMELNFDTQKPRSPYDLPAVVI